VKAGEWPGVSPAKPMTGPKSSDSAIK